MEEKINKLQKEILKKIKCINQGGCIHFAYYFSKRLRELGIKHSIVFQHDTYFTLTYKNYIPSHHVVVYIEGIGYIDGESTMQSFEDGMSVVRFSERISLTKLDYFRNKFEWNFIYDKSQNRKVEKLINKYIY